MTKFSVLALVLLIPNTHAALPVKVVGKIAGGIVEGFIGVDDVKACIESTLTTLGDVEKAVADFEKETAKDVMEGLGELEHALHELPAAIKACRADENIVKLLVHGLSQFKSPMAFVYHSGKNLVVNHHDIYKEITTAVSDFKSKKWLDFGVQVGTALHKLIIGAEIVV